MVNLSPKQMFLADDDRAREFGNIVHHPLFQTGMAMAMAEFTLTKEPTTEELAGARKFITVLLNMVEKHTSPQVTPFKSIATALPKKPVETPPAPK